MAYHNAELAASARLKDQFLAIMSHELRTPLTGILALSESLQEQVYGALNPAQSSAIRDIEKCGRRLLSRINDILDVAMLEAGKIELLPGPVQVEQLCRASLILVKEAAQKKDIATSMAIDESPDALIADEHRLKQILVQLLSNAVKFSHRAGKIGLEVRTDRANAHVRFTVWDTGIGISAENLPRLFQPFIQLDARLSRQYEGSGLGLTLVKRLTDLHGGRTEVESQLGVGSQFSVILPWLEIGTSL